MPSFGHRSLLGLRKALPATVAATAARGATRSCAAAVRNLATAQAYDSAHPSSSLPPPYILHGPSPIASGSKFTLDKLLDPARPDNSIWPALSFACEEELLAALVQPPGSTAGRWIDPGTAYLGLRSGGLFTHYLALIVPRIRTVYTNLRPSGLHQLLVSDLLLRNPDQRALREILVEETAPGHTRAPTGDKLRAGLVTQVYRVIAPGIRRRTAPRLPRPALLSVARALRSQDSVDLLPDIFYELAHTSTWEPESAWPALQIVLHLARRGRSAEALRLLQYPIALGKLPAEALGRNSATHPEAAALVVQTAIARTALSWGLDVRARRAVGDVIDTMLRSEVSPAALDLVLQACRAADVTRDPESIKWAQQTLLRLAKTDAALLPTVPSSALDLHLDALPAISALEFYADLPVGRYEPIAARHISRISLAGPSQEVLSRLVAELGRSNEAGADTAAALPGLLHALAQARRVPEVRVLYAEWRSQQPHALLSERTTLALIRASTRGTRPSGHTAFAREVLNDYLSTTGRVAPAADAAIVALHAHALIGGADSKGQSQARDALMQSLIAAVGQDGAEARLRALAARHPLVAHRLQHLVLTHGFDIGSPAVAIAAACAARNWTALGAVAEHAHALSAGEKAYIKALEAVRRGRGSAAARRFRSAAESDPLASMLVPTAAAVLHRLAARGDWAHGLDVASAALRAAETEGAEGADDLAEHVAVFLTGLVRASKSDGVDLAFLQAAWVAHSGTLLDLASALETPSKTLLAEAIESAAVLCE